MPVVAMESQCLKTTMIHLVDKSDFTLSDHKTKADQNTGGALLESPVRTAMHGKSRVSSVISVELN